MKSTLYVARLVGVPQRTLAQWVNKGLLRPAGACAGRFRSADWGDKDIHELRQLMRLRRAGVSAQALGDAMGYLRTLGHNPLSSGSFFVFGGAFGPTSLVKITSEGEAIELLKAGRGQLILPVCLPDEDGGSP